MILNHRDTEDTEMRTVLSWFGYRIVYVCPWGVYDYRYDGIDAHAGRPIHRKMSVAPPWAKMKMVRL